MGRQWRHSVPRKSNLSDCLPSVRNGQVRSCDFAF